MRYALAIATTISVNTFCLSWAFLVVITITRKLHFDFNEWLIISAASAQALKSRG
ncbi:hypothetical protein [Pedobacter xixiisoli]|uniref:hypothetical protein n=1 Tax=Pedobacter xixiisoli TaxID=1476464 RepID=UPI001486019B|nr:hypothetical protein [Pedobacter xixiisoli]